jgi:hypothetical protein
MTMADQLNKVIISPTERSQMWTSKSPERRNAAVSATFVLQIQLVLGISVFFGKEALSGIRAMAESQDIDLASLYHIVAVSLACSIIACGCFLAFAMLFSRKVIHFSFIAPSAAAVFTCAAISYYTIEKNQGEAQVIVFKATATLCLVLGIAYYISRKHLPFPASTLHVALRAVQDHPWLLKQSLTLMALHNLWLALWAFGACGVFFWTEEQRQLVPCRELGSSEAERYADATPIYTPKGFYGAYLSPSDVLCEGKCSVHPVVAILFVLSVYWTNQTFKNVLHVSVASTLGKWWIGESPVPTSIFSALPMSFGSLCADSFQTPPLRPVNLFETRTNAEDHNNDAPNGQAQKQEVLDLGQLRQHNEYPNSLSFLYVGLYGHDYVSSGNRAMAAFRSRGWNHLLKDRSVSNAMMLFKFVIAVTSGCLAWTAESTFMGHELSNEDEAEWYERTSFLVAFILGWKMGSSLLMFIEAAVRTIIVAVTDSSPEDDFRKARLFIELKRGWQEVYPGMWNE